MRLISCTSVFVLVSSTNGLLIPRDAPQCSNQLKNPSPPGLVCEKTGYIKRPSVIATAKIASQNLCRDYCFGNPQCLSYSYATNNQSCTHYHNGILNSGFVRTPNGAIYANRRCYKRVCSCPAPEVLCSGTCADTTSDPNHCGGCNSICPSAQTCQASTCQCPSDGDQLCGNSCVDTLTDPSHCGGCDSACGQGASCSGGSCTCPSGQDLCAGPNGPCTDLTTDSNCGGCGVTCFGDQICTAQGTCACPGGQILCGDQCTDPNTTSDCGTCGNTCGDGASCSGGACSCPGGQDLCSGPNGPCADLTTTSNCGACGTKCVSTQVCTGQGTCECPDGGILCNGECVDPTTNDDHCGSCTTQCTTSATSCVQSKCESWFRLEAEDYSRNFKGYVSNTFPNVYSTDAWLNPNSFGDRMVLSGGRLINIDYNKRRPFGKNKDNTYPQTAWIDTDYAVDFATCNVVTVMNLGATLNCSTSSINPIYFQANLGYQEMLYLWALPSSTPSRDTSTPVNLLIVPPFF